jgi:hypothetical protein
MADTALDAVDGADLGGYLFVGGCGCDHRLWLCLVAKRQQWAVLFTGGIGGLDLYRLTGLEQLACGHCRPCFGGRLVLFAGMDFDPALV